MGMVTVAQRLAVAVLEGEDPKDFLRRMSQQRKIDMRFAGKEPVTPCEEWPEWDMLEPWQQVAAKELEDELNAYFKLRHNDHLEFQVSNSENEWFRVFENETAAIQCAEAEVVSQLEDDPETYGGEWTRQFIDMDKVRRDLYDSARDDEYWNEQYPEYEDKIKELIDRGLLGEDPLLSSTGRKRKLTRKVESWIDDLWEKMIDDHANERLEDPQEFLEEIYGKQDSWKECMKIGGIDTHAAAEWLVGADGWVHTISNNDGLSHDLPSGAIYILQ